jgi:acetyltransferase-like isoleucine patch superfamily enzyme
MLGGEHRTDWITTYPFSELLKDRMDYKGHPRSKGNVIIGNDVWIGREAMILSGVTIGNGAVIGARSVVAKHVTPYSIIAGNPAKHLKWRFDESLIERLQTIAWWDWPHDKVLDALPLLLSNKIEEFIRVGEKILRKQ